MLSDGHVQALGVALKLTFQGDNPVQISGDVVLCCGEPAANLAPCCSAAHLSRPAAWCADRGCLCHHTDELPE